MGAAMNVPDLAHKAFQTFVIHEPFDHFVTGDRWTVVASNGGGVTELDAAGGGVTLDTADSGSADNDETYLRTSNELFKFAVGKPLYGGFRIQYAEAATDDANVAVGFMNAVAADSILDNGGGPKADYSGVVVYKVDGGTKWIFETSQGTSQTTTTSTTTAGGSAVQTIEIFVDDHSPGVLRAYAKVDGVQLVDANNVPIAHFITLNSPTEMHAFIGVKNGGSNEETLTIKDALLMQTI